MNVERITEEYLKQKRLLDSLNKTVGEYKEMLSKVIDEQGDPDEKGHKWYHAGRYMLKRQKSQGDKFLNHERAEEWAKKKGIWDQVNKTLVVLDEDAILGYIWDHKELAKEFEELYESPPEKWSFIQPVEEEQYDL